MLPRCNADRARRIGGGKTAGSRKSRSGTAADVGMYLTATGINIMRRIKLPPLLLLLIATATATAIATATANHFICVWNGHD